MHASSSLFRCAVTTAVRIVVVIVAAAVGEVVGVLFIGATLSSGGGEK